jgi:hypothetical protein
MKALSISKQFICSLFILGVTVFLASSCKSTQNATGEEAITIAREAYTYGLPLVLMDITRRQQTNVQNAGGGKGAPMNQLNNLSGFPTASDNSVVAPNADTYYCIAWGDFKEGPLVFQMPNPNGRYYVMPFLDAFTNVYESVSPRTNFANGGTFFITRDSTSPATPDGMTRVVCPTSFFWLLGRIQCNGTTDGQMNVIPLQKNTKLMPYKYWGKTYTPPANTIDPTVPVGSPNDIVQDSMPIDAFFNYLNRLLTENRTPAADSTVLNRFKKINVGRGMKFNKDSLGLNKNQLAVIENLPQTMFTSYRAYAAQGSKPINGWIIRTTGMGTYGTDYKQRAVTAVMGLGCNLPQDAVYPSSYVDSQTGNKYVGSNNYKITFKKGMLPPAEGFWSLTMYNQKGYFVSNPYSTNPPVYAVGHDTSAKFTYAPDSSLTILIQNKPPTDPKMKNNWLPAPTDTFYLMMRLYYPSPDAPSILNSTWTPPGIVINN